MPAEDGVSPIRVLVAESDMVYAGKLVNRIAQDAERLRVVGLAADCHGAAALAEAAPHDLILLGRVDCEGFRSTVRGLRKVTPAPIVALVGENRPLAGEGDGLEELSGFVPRTLEPRAMADSLFEIALLAGAARRNRPG